MSGSGQPSWTPYTAGLARMLAITDIQMALGDQKIDMVVSPLVRDADLIMREITREAQLIG